MKIKTQEVRKDILKSIQIENKNVPMNDEEDEDDDDNESLDSDQELQLAFARKELTPGLNIQIEKPKIFVNDEEGLKRKLKDFYLNMEWIERMDIIVPNIAKEEVKTENDLADNDFKRESLFFKQAESAVQLCLPRLKGFGILTKRPEDYFAQMAKPDDHMKRVREALLTKHAELEKREKIRKLRELKKMGKQIQIEAEKKKQIGKKVYKSEKQFVDENEPERSSKSKNLNDPKNKKTSKKAAFKDKKFGFGGRKKRSKYNTAESYAEAYKNPTKKKANSSSNKNGSFRKNSFKKTANKNKPKKKFGKK